MWRFVLDLIYVLSLEIGAAGSGPNSLKMDYFEIFGLPPVLNLDLSELEKRFYELSRKYHPDFHNDGSHTEQEKALRMTARLTDAYRTLKDPTRRAEYLLESNGFIIDRSKVPKTLLMEVFDINEELERIRAGRQSGQDIGELVDELKLFHKQIAEKRVIYDEELYRACTRWDAVVSSGASEEDRQQELISLSEIISRASYIRNLEIEIENEVSL